MEKKRYLSRAAVARVLNLTPAYVWSLPESVLPVAALVDQGVRVEKVYNPEAVEVLRAARAAKAAAKAQKREAERNKEAA